MHKFSLLLVDDEEEVIQIIIKKLNWEELGFQVVGYANNGMKALELMEELQPDVVMTDIKMPYMDGIELTKHIKESFPETKILFFTGFDEFEYAREAVHMEVEEYILKPVNAIELRDIFANLRDKLLREINEKKNVENLQKYYMESLPLLRSNFYTKLIDGHMEKTSIEKYLADYQISLDGPYYACLVIRTSNGLSKSEINPLLLATSVQKQAEERLQEKWRAKVFSYLGKTVMIVQVDKESRVSELTDDCDRFCRYVKRVLGAVVTVGIGDVCEDITLLSYSYQRAKEAVSYRVLYGGQGAMNIKEIAPPVNQKMAGEDSLKLANVFKMIRLESKSNMILAVEEYLDGMMSMCASLQQRHIALMEMISELYKFVIRNDIHVEELTGNPRHLYEKLVEMEPNMLKNWLVEISLLCSEKLGRVRTSSTKELVLRAKAYVASNYAEEELSLDSICSRLGVSNCYFSTIFKKETGETFIGYLTEYRMQRASMLLLETDDKNYVVAKKVGYSDANYFSYVFKRQFGVSPSKYRLEYMK